MSELSEVLLENAFDYRAIARARRANYAYLADVLADHALFKKLDENTVPLGFPIRLKKRDEVRQFLISQERLSSDSLANWRVCSGAVCCKSPAQCPPDDHSL